MPIVPNSKLPCYDVSLAPYNGNIQQAINDAVGHAGGTVYLPAGTYPLTAPLTIPSNVATGISITLLGDGPNATIISTATQQVMLYIKASFASVQGITFQGAATVSGTPAEGIVIGDTDTNQVIRSISMHRCIVRSTGSWCLHALAAPSISIDCSYTECQFHDNQVGGAVLLSASNTTHYFKSCSIDNFREYGVAIGGAHGCSFIDCIFEGQLARTFNHPFFYADQAAHCLLENVWFEDDGQASGIWFIQVDRTCHGLTILNPTFRRDSGGGASAQAVWVNSSVDICKGVVIMNPEIITVDGPPTTGNHILIASGDHEIYVIGGVARQVAYAPTYPVLISDSSSRTMTVGGNNRLTLQRLTDAQITALTNTVLGQMVYNSTTNRIDVRTNAGWVGIATGPR